MIPRKAYRKVLKVLEYYKAQDDEDRRDNPGAIPCGWQGSILRGIEQVLSEEKVYPVKSRAEQVLWQLVHEGKLVRYCGDVSFPDRQLMEEEEITKRAMQLLKRINK